MDSQNIYGVQPQKSIIQSTTEYFNTNDMMGNVIFLIMILLVFIILFMMLSTFFMHILAPSRTPHMIDGMVNAMKEYKISQDPKNASSKTIFVSENRTGGLEFTWSYWMFIEDLDYRKGDLKNVFIKGDNKYVNDKDKYESEETLYEDQVKELINGPGVYLTPFENKLMFVFNTYDNVVESFEVGNLPMQKWFNVVIRCENKKVDVFVNGSFAKRHTLKSLPRQNYNDVYIGKDGGFSGYVSNLWYYDHALGTKAIEDIYTGGVNINMIGGNSNSYNKGESIEIDGGYKRNFLSFRWEI